MSSIATFITALATAVIAVGTAILACTARRALTTWREEARAARDHDLASRLLRRAYAVQQTTSHARDLLTWASEIAAELDFQDASRSEYGAHIKELVMREHGPDLARAHDGKLQLDLREAELWWNVAMRSLYTPLVEALDALRWALDMSPFATKLDAAATSFGAPGDRDWVKRWRQILNTAGDEATSKEVDSAVAKIEKQLLPYLRILPVTEPRTHE